jgi:opacity protein-like surface antigen
MKKLCVLALSLISLSVLADNDRGFYLGAGASSIKDSQDGVDEIGRIRAAELFGGYKYNNALGIELRLGSGKNVGKSDTYLDASGATQSGKLEREIDSYQSIYYKPELVNDEAKLYALIGYTQLSSSGRVLNDAGAVVVPAKDVSVSGLSYGVGVGFVINEHFNINFEYKNICDEISDEPKVASVNVDYRF